jgi:HEAT repeat protein
MGEKAAGLVPNYLAWLRSHDLEVQIEGAVFLGSVGPQAKIAVPELLEAANGTNGRLRQVAASALWSIDRQTNIALKVFTSGLQSTNYTSRQIALSHLRQMGAAAKDAGPMILAALQDPDSSVRRDAEVTLRDIAPELLVANAQAMNQQKSSNVARLVRTIQTGDFKERYNALEALPVFGPDAKPAVAALIEALNAPAPSLPGNFGSIAQMNSRRAAGIALGEIGPEARAAVPALMGLVKNPRDGYSAVYCQALGRIGPEAKEALPVLEDALRDEDRGIRFAAADALTRIVPTTASNAVATLRGLQHDPELAKVWVANNGLARLTDQLDFNNPSSRHFRLCASASLWRLGLEKESPAPALLAELSNKNYPDRTFIEMLGDLGPDARSALPALIKFLSPDVFIGNRRAAAIAIRKIDPAEAERLGLPGILGEP